MYPKNRAWIELNTEHLKHNVTELTKLLAPGCELMPAVKANAYGHGLLPISVELAKLGICHFCVATAPEGAALRQSGVEGEILILGYTHPDAFSLLTRYQLTQTVVDADYAKRLSSYGKPLKVHIGVDTGMHRLGEPFENPDAIASLWNYRNLEITGVFSHLCVADSLLPEHIRFTRLQFERFNRLIDTLKNMGITGFASHIQGSYGILNYPEYHYDLVRPGIALYGCHSTLSEQTRQKPELKPVLTLKSRLATVRHLSAGEGAGYGLAYTAPASQRIGTVSIGYADGIPRALSGKGQAIIRGQRVPFIGRICMDQLLVDLSHVAEAAPGDEVILIGTDPNKGGQISAEEVAALCDTISNEILSGLSERIERFSLPPTFFASHSHEYPQKNP